jgi:hypothetical protein
MSASSYSERIRRTVCRKVMRFIGLDLPVEADGVGPIPSDPKRMRFEGVDGLAEKVSGRFDALGEAYTARPTTWYRMKPSE